MAGHETTGGEPLVGVHPLPAAGLSPTRQRSGLAIALLAAIGHDLRTPLAGIKAAVGSLRQDDVAWSPEEHDALLATIEDASDRLTDLIANLLDMSRLRSGGVTVQLTAVAVDEVVSRAVLGIPPGAIVVEIPETLPLVEADPGLLERAVANLVDNARRHSPAGSPVVLGASVRGGRVHLRVVDHGSGVAPESWGSMFAPFQRLDDHTGGAGAGLGLAIVTEFCDAMGVTVTPHETVGGGLTMTLAIPLASETPPVPETAVRLETPVRL